MSESTSFCPYCGAPLAPDFVFCPKCGKGLQAKPPSASIPMQILIYAVSVLLPPFGFWPAIKYIRSSDPEAKRVGLIAIVLSSVSTILMLWFIFYFLNIYLSALNQALNGI